MYKLIDYGLQLVIPTDKNKFSLHLKNHRKSFSKGRIGGIINENLGLVQSILNMNTTSKKNVQNLFRI